jgi:hypothetical protein
MLSSATPTENVWLAVPFSEIVTDVYGGIVNGSTGSSNGTCTEIPVSRQAGTAADPLQMLVWAIETIGAPIEAPGKFFGLLV